MTRIKLLKLVISGTLRMVGLQSNPIVIMQISHFFVIYFKDNFIEKIVLNVRTIEICFLFNLNWNLNFIKFSEVEANVIESAIQLLFFHLKQFVTIYAIFIQWIFVFLFIANVWKLKEKPFNLRYVTSFTNTIKSNQIK